MYPIVSRYRAPEVQTADYTYTADVYSLGVILHFLLSGYVPEPDETIQFESVEWEGISKEAKGMSCLPVRAASPRYHANARRPMTQTGCQGLIEWNGMFCF